MSNKDFLGSELSVGDKVIFMKLKYRELVIGTIVSLANKSCKIQHEEDNLCRTECRQYYNQLIKYEK